jgi:hypothetical protein
MRLNDFEIMDKLRMLLSTIASEGRITENEANRIAFYALYNNSCANMSSYDVDENMCSIDYSSNSNKSDLQTSKE